MRASLQKLCASDRPLSLCVKPRLDHDNIHYQAAHTGGTDHLSESADEAAVERKMRGSSLHGGPTAHHITCVFELKSVGKGEGGFGCLPGCKPPEPHAEPHPCL